jgi:hypothetical protein
MSDVLLDWRSLLVADHPRLFGTIVRVEGEEGALLGCAGWPNVGPGWRQILERLCRRVEAAIASEPAATFAFVQIKEKFGRLRAYQQSSRLSSAAELAVDTARELAEARSAFICEVCGRRGHLWDDHGWYRTACDDHGQGRPLAPKPGRAGIEISRHYVGNRSFVTARRYDFDRDAFTSIAVPVDYDVERRRWRDERDDS